MEDASQQSGRFRVLDPKTAAERLADRPDDEIVKILTEMHVGYAVEILEEFEEERRIHIANATLVPRARSTIDSQGVEANCSGVSTGSAWRAVSPHPANRSRSSVGTHPLTLRVLMMVAV